MHPKIGSFLCALWRPLGPPIGCHSVKNQVEKIYTYDFVKKGYLRVLTMFLEYYPLDKHFKHGFKLFGPIFNIYPILWITLFCCINA